MICVGLAFNLKGPQRQISSAPEEYIKKKCSRPCDIIMEVITMMMMAMMMMMMIMARMMMMRTMMMMKILTNLDTGRGAI